MQRYQTEDEHRKAMRAKINKTIKRGRRRKRIIRRLRKAVPGICIGVLIAGMGAWCIAAPLPDPDDYEPYRFQAENGQWYTQEEYEQMSRERDAYHQREREEAEKEAQMIRDYQEQYQKDQEAEWKLYQEQTRTGLIHSMDFDANDAYLLEKIAMAEAESEDTEGKALVMLVVLNRVWDARFPDTIEEVIMQDGAFTPVSNGRYDKVEPDADCMKAMELITVEHWDESQGALYFEKASDESTWHEPEVRTASNGSQTCSSAAALAVSSMAFCASIPAMNEFVIIMTRVLFSSGTFARVAAIFSASLSCSAVYLLAFAMVFPPSVWCVVLLSLRLLYIANAVSVNTFFVAFAIFC